MTAPVIGQTSTPRLTAYISVDMFKNNGRRGVSVDQLVPRGRTADQDAALAQYIESAAAWVDSFCQQIMVATYDTQVKRVNVNRNGYVVIHPRYTPVIAVTAFSIGATPAQMTAVSSLAGIGVNPDYFSVPADTGALPANTPQGPIQFGNGAILGRHDQAWAQYTYVNGYPVTTLTDAAAPGDVLLSLADTTGIVAGNTWLTVHAGAKRFHFLAGATSTAGTNGIGTGPGTVVCPPVPLSIPIAGPNATLVAALPQDFIDANIIVTRALIKEMVPSAAKEGAPAAGDDLIEAAGMLRAFVAPVV